MWVQSSCSNRTLFHAEHDKCADSLAMICRKHPWFACCFLVLLVLSEACENKSVSAAPGAPPTVQVVEVTQRDVPVYHEWIATLDGYVNAVIQPQVSGYLVQQNYREGALVHKNDVLFKIDPRPFQAILDQAKAQLAQAEAQLGKTQLDVQRDTPLAREKAIAQSQLDNDVQANLAEKATVEADKAAVEQAEINLEFTNVRSLVDGVAGIATGQVGNLVGPQTVLTTVSQLDPIKVYFVASEQQYLAFVQRNPTAASREKAERELVLDLVLSDGTTYPRKGKFFAADQKLPLSGGMHGNSRAVADHKQRGRGRSNSDLLVIVRGLQLLIAPQQRLVEFRTALNDLTVKRRRNLIQFGVRAIEQNDAERGEQTGKKLCKRCAKSFARAITFGQGSRRF